MTDDQREGNAKADVLFFGVCGKRGDIQHEVPAEGCRLQEKVSREGGCGFLVGVGQGPLCQEISGEDEPLEDKRCTEDL